MPFFVLAASFYVGDNNGLHGNGNKQINNVNTAVEVVQPPPPPGFTSPFFTVTDSACSFMDEPQVLSHYDEVQKEGARLTLGQGGTAQDGSGAVGGGEEKRKVSESLKVEVKDASEYYTTEEMAKFKKPKKVGVRVWPATIEAKRKKRSQQNSDGPGVCFSIGGTLFDSPKSWKTRRKTDSPVCSIHGYSLVEYPQVSMIVERRFALVGL